MTEAALVLGSLTSEELDDANRYCGLMIRAWQTSSKDPRARVGTGSDGPFHALAALRLAILAEMTQRGGAEAWHVGMPTAGHIAASTLELYERRYSMRALEPRMVGRDLCRVCVICGEEKPQTEEHYDRPSGEWSSICRACNRIDYARLRELQEEFDPKPPPSPKATLEEVAALL